MFDSKPLHCQLQCKVKRLKRNVFLRMQLHDHSLGFRVFEKNLIFSKKLIIEIKRD